MSVTLAADALPEVMNRSSILAMHAEHSMAHRAKCELVAGIEPEWFGRTALVESWRRSVPALVDPGRLRAIPTVPESWLDDTALDLLSEPLASMASSLEGTDTALLLTDFRGYVLGRWFEGSAAGRHLDSVGSLRSADLSEATVGTNAVSLAVTTGSPTEVVGAEHFSNFFSHSACVAEPINDPITGDLMAVITLTAPVNPRVETMRGWLATMRVHVLDHLSKRLSRPRSLRVEDTEEWALRSALAETGGDIPRTCELLGLSRATVYRRIRRYGISATGIPPQ